MPRPRPTPTCRASAKGATLEEIRDHGHVLTPGRYVGAPPEEDDGEPFDQKLERLTQTLYRQMAEAADMDAVIKKNLSAVIRDS